ncbi:MAG TPA: SRPBCC domain-containing protein, partial [Methanomicrobiales archaeon]|nr:SRPBCC domain-containing protein [Methanomicrobiales archaeon]
FETRVTITEREYPTMVATGGGAASDSSFEMESGMTIDETDTGSTVEWWTGADVSGRIAQLGNRVLDPVADRIVNQFFTNIQQQMTDVDESEQGRSITKRLRNLL